MSFLNKILLIKLFILFQINYFSQSLPVQANLVLNPPHPITYSKYTDLGSNSLQLNLSFLDLNEPSWDVYFSISIESQDIKISTKPNFKPSIPTTLFSGVPKILQGSDFYEYFDFNNVTFQNIDASTINSSGNLPEGFYTFSVTVLDYRSGIPISLTTRNSAFLSLEQPPIIISPACETAIEPSSNPNIFFNWQMSGGSSPSTTLNSTYKLFLYQVTDDDTDYQSAVQNNKALKIFESDFLNTPNFVFNSSNPSFTNLQPGKKYVYRIRALDAQQNNIYNNDGYTEWCWFYYGYPDDGYISAKFPEDNHIFKKMDNPYLSWDISDKAASGQQFNYELKIYEVYDGQDPADALNNPYWLSESLPPSQNPNGEFFNITKSLGDGKKYVWYVQASSSGQLVASSDTLVFNSSPFLSSFIAGNSVVKVVSLENNNLDSLRGTARIQLSSSSQDYIETSFSNLQIAEGATFILNSGEIIFDLSDRDSLLLSPNLFENGNAYFIYEKGRINRNGFNIYGRVSWPLPHPVSNNSKSFVTSNYQWFGVKETYTLFGDAKLDSSNVYDLIDPMNFRIDLSTNSEISLNDNNYDLRLLGDVFINSSVKTSDDMQYKFYFGYPTPEDQLNYIEVNNIQTSSYSPTNTITPIDNLNIGLFFKDAIIDFSETKSPGKLSGDLFWKGVFVENFTVRMYESNYDASNQVTLPSIFDFDEDLSGENELWVNSQGLHFKYSNSITSQDGTLFNRFKTDLYTTINIVDNHVESNNSFITGSIRIPIVSKTENFSFQIPIADNGLQDGFLDEDLTQRALNFNPYGGENAVNISLNRAVFSDNDHLKFEIDFEVPALSSTVSGVDDFRVYGNGLIGFGGINKSLPLTNQVAGVYKGYSTFIEEVGAAFVGGDYAFSYKATIDMGSDVNGDNGPPVLAISSVESAGTIDYVQPIGTSLPPPDIEVPDSAVGEQELTIADMKISVDNPIVELDGYLNLKQNDPKWGTCFSGGINGKIKIPSQVDLGANMIAGVINDMDYWYFDAYFNDTEGMGLSVFGAFNLTAMEGRIYRHMSYDTIDKEYTVDPNIDFGAGLYMQIIDPQGGRMLAADIAAELEVSGSDFVVNMQGDLKMINDGGRSPTGGMGKGAIKAAGKAVAEEVVEAIGPISLDIPIGGGNMKVTAEGTKSGSLNYTKNDLEIGIAGDVGSAPSVNFLYKNSNNDFNFGASADGNFDLGLSLSDGKSLSMGMSGTKSGFFNMNFDDISFNSSIDRAEKTGNLDFAYGDKSLKFNVLSDGGSFDLNIDQSNSFNAGFRTTGSAYLGLKINNNTFNISGDKSTGTGLLDLDIDGVAMTTSVSTSQKSASFNLNTSGLKLDVNGQYNVGGSFLLEYGNTKFDVATDLQAKTGHLDFETGDTRLLALLDSNNQGSLLVKHGPVEFGISGNSSGTAGSVVYKDDNIDFDVFADRDNSTGGLNLAFADKSISSLISSDSSNISLGYGSYNFDVITDNSNYGLMSFKNGSDIFKVEADLLDKSGTLLFVNGNNRIYASGSSDATGELDLSIEGNDVSGLITNDSASLNISSGIYEFSAAGEKNGNSGEISFKVGDVNTKLGLNVAEQAGEIFYGTDAEYVHIKGNKVNNTGLIDINSQIIDLLAVYDDSIYLKSGPFSMAKYSDGNGFAKYIDNGIGVGLYKTQDLIGLGIFSSDNNLYLAHALNNQVYDSVYFSGQGQILSLSRNSNTGRFNLENSLFNISLEASDNGQGSIGIQKDDINVNLAADIVNKSGSFSFQKSDLNVNSNIDIINKAFDINYSQGDILSSVIYSQSLKKISFEESGNFSVSAEKNNSLYKTVFTKDGHTVIGKVNNSLKEIEYQGMNSIVILGNNKEYIDYNGQDSARIQNKKVYINGEEVYDYSNVPNLSNIDFSKINFPNLDLSSVNFTGLDLSLVDLSFVDFTGLDFGNIDLSGIDFTGLDFGNIDLSGIDFTRFDMSAVNLSGINMSGLNLNGLNLSGLNLTGLDFGNIDLSGIDFTGLNLDGINLSGLDFTGINFGNIDLSGINFTGLNLDGINLSGLDFTGLDFGNIDLSGLDFTGLDFGNIDLSGIDFTGIDLNGVNLSGLDFTGFDFGNINLSAINFSSIPNFSMNDLPNLNLSGIDFTGIDLTGLDLSGIDFSGFNFGNIDLSGIDFTGINFGNIDLSGIDFTGFNFGNLDLSGIDFTGIDLSGIDLSVIDFTGFDLSGIDLSGIDFTGINVALVDLSGIDFTGFDFTGFDLSEIDFTGLDFTGVDLSGIDFTGVDFTGVDLSFIDFTGVNFPSIPDVNWSNIFQFGDVKLKIYLDGLNSSMTILKGVDSIHVKSIDMSDGEIICFIANQNFSIGKIGFDYTLSYDEYSAKYIKTENSLEINKGNDYQLFLSEDEGAVKYENYNVSVSETNGFNYDDGYNSTSLSDNGILVKSDDKELSYDNNQEIYLKYDNSKNFKITPQSGLEINYDGKLLAVASDQLSYSDDVRAYDISPSELSIIEGEKQLLLNDNRAFLAYNSQNSIDYTNGTLSVSNEDKTLSLSNEMQISYSDPNNIFDVSPNGLEINKDGKLVKFTPNELEIQYESDKKLKISNDQMELNYENNEIKLGSSALYFSDGNRSIDLSKDSVTISENGNKLFLSQSSFGLNYGSSKSIYIDKADKKFNFNYDNISASFSSGESLSFTDGQKSFSLGSSGLSLSDGDKTMSVLNESGSPALELTSGTDRFYLNKSGFSVDYDNKRFAINDQEYLHIDFDSSTYVKVDNNNATFNKDGNELIIGGNTNFLELRNSSRSLALTQDEKLTYNEGSYFASLSKNLNIELSDGTRTLKLFEDSHALKYIQGNYEFGIRGGSGNKPGIDLSVDGNTIFVEGERNSDVTVGLVSQEFGSVSVSCDKNRNIDGAFSYNGQDYFLQAGEQGLSFSDPSSESQNANAEILDGATPAPEMQGPQYIGPKITEGTDGRVSGLVQVYYNSAQEHFIGNAAVASTMPPCVDAGLAIEVTPSYWKFDLGTENDMIQIYPACSGFGGGGWLGLTPSTFNVGVFAGWAARAEVRIGGSACGCKVWGACEAELGVRAEGEYMPSFLIKRAGVWVRVYVGLGVDFWCPIGGSLTIAEAELTGTLDVYFESRTRVQGTLAGYINVLDLIKADFDMGFDHTF